VNLKRVRRWYRLDGPQLRMRVRRWKYVPQADNHYGRFRATCVIQTSSG
jgi:hypothetical protein